MNVNQILVGKMPGFWKIVKIFNNLNISGILLIILKILMFNFHSTDLINCFLNERERREREREKQ
jgi:hypothetical protein